ncbi:hypothetical protein L1987_58096 [Smallanthus sonchifolius]|uniref:Uncharacterized protein n=1 Tax=Smallanthus sonchifolius TaxID=185202 RepID=A0ACB9DEU9_9ASTR|nr:hypothetical protein L1987_58096 [Smallanthus sonchifolius]
MLQNPPTFRWIHKLMEQHNSPIICIRLGRATHVIVVSSSIIACEFLKTQDEIFASRPESLSGYLISDGFRATIMAPLGNQWRMMRRILNQSILSLPIHKWLQPKRDEEADHLLSYINNQIEKQNSVTEGGLINIRIVSQQFCGNVIRNMIFGTRFFREGTVKKAVVAGYFIPKGSHVLISRLGLGRNPDVWKDLMWFDPDPHLCEEGKQVVLTDNELRMLSFSTGKRGCPGVILGSTITTMLLARMIQGFTWEMPYDKSANKLVENYDDLHMAKPFVAIAKTRLPQYLYPKI